MILRAMLVLPVQTANLVRSALCTSSPHRIDVVYQTARTESIQACIEQESPDVVFLDPSIDGGETVRTWRDSMGPFPILVCLADSASHAVAAFEAGGRPNTEEAPNSEPLSVSRLEWEHIQRVLHEYGGNISETARALKMHRRTLQRKLAKRPVKS